LDLFLQKKETIVDLYFLPNYIIVYMNYGYVKFIFFYFILKKDFKACFWMCQVFINRNILCANQHSHANYEKFNLDHRINIQRAWGIGVIF